MLVKRGDTLVEVVFAIAIFSLVASISITLMNAGLSTAQASLEVTMAREEIDAQAEAIRFVHNSFSLEREFEQSEQVYRNLWLRLSRDSGAAESGTVNSAKDVPELSVNNCSEIYGNGEKSILNNPNKLVAFVINTRALDPEDTTFNNNNLKEIVVSTKDASTVNRFSETPVNPRVLFAESPGSTNETSDQMSEIGNYRYVSRAEGIWVIATRDETGKEKYGTTYIPEFYDFHIYTCWIAPGKRNPSTIGTIIRLYNPELVEDITGKRSITNSLGQNPVSESAVNIPEESGGTEEGDVDAVEL